MKDKDRGKIDAVVYRENSKVPVYKVSGSWLNNLYLAKYNEIIEEYDAEFQVFKLPNIEGDEDTDWDEIYRMNDIALNVNAIDEELSQVLPPTDSRFRPDMRAMERGEFDFSM